MWHRVRPALSLFLLAPLIAEYLLGSLSFSQLLFFPIMALMYGGGALVVREAARRTGRSWPTILTLGLSYAFVEEGLATQSLFNPHYHGLHLLDYGYIPRLGIGAPWTVYVLLLHVVWSIAVPIGLVEWLYSAQRTTSWLKTFGFVVIVLVYLFGVALVTFGTYQDEKNGRFIASSAQLAVTALIAIILIAAAFLLFRPRKTTPTEASTTPGRGPLVLGVISFIAGSVFQLVTQLGSGYLTPSIGVPILLAMPLVVFTAARAARSSGLAPDTIADLLVLGALLAYCWLGFFLTVRLHGVDTLPGQFFPFTIIIAIVAWRFTRRQAAAESSTT